MFWCGLILVNADKYLISAGSIQTRDVLSEICGVMMASWKKGAFNLMFVSTLWMMMMITQLKTFTTLAAEIFLSLSGGVTIRKCPIVTIPC